MHGWAVGRKSATSEYLILHTVNGGETWTEQTIDHVMPPQSIFCVWFADETTGWIGGYNGAFGVIFFTDDGGETWQTQQDLFEKPIFDIQMINKDVGWAVGADFIYHTTNGTYIYNSVEDNQKQDNDVYINPNPSNGIFTINSPVFKENDGDVKMIITDITGREILNSQFSILNSKIDISKQPQGIYFLTIQFQNNNQAKFITKKIIKQ
jgi:photosystem II stability/assembly factor-like uncharacterized protein